MWKFDWLAAMAAFMLVAAPVAEAQSRLATNASLSVEAIKLQSASEKLLTLEQEQRAARDRERNFAMQGAALGVAGGAVAGAAIACVGAALQGRRCNEDTMIAGAVPGAVAGGVYGHQKGKQVARTQNVAAARENEIKRRLQIAAKQLDTARLARQQAERVAAQNVAKLKQMRAAVLAGKASKQQLQIARADANADAKQIRAAAAAMGGGANSLRSSSQATQAQSRSEAQSLQNAQGHMTNEQARTTTQYNTLVKAINASAL